jgi:hypothetical protein
MSKKLMYMEQKSGAGEARIGYVTFSRSRRTIYYKDKAFQSANGKAIRGNYYGYVRESYLKWQNDNSIKPQFIGEYWISAPKRDGGDRHPLERSGEVFVDSDAVEEYLMLRNLAAIPSHEKVHLC